MIFIILFLLLIPIFGFGVWCGYLIFTQQYSKYGAHSVSYNQKSMQCCSECGYALGSKNQCLNGNCVQLGK